MPAAPEVPKVRTSERLTFKRCRWQWDRQFNDLVRPRRTAPALRFGSLVHASLERYYRPGTKRGPHPAKTFKRLFDKDLAEQGALGYRDEDGVWSDAGVMGIDLLEGYIEEYGKDLRYEVVATEQTFQVPILNSKGKVVCIYTGILDGIWRDLNENRLFIVDHKTAAQINTGYLALDEQAGAYWTFGQDWIREKGLIKPKDQLAGMLYNFLRKAKGDTRPMNAEGHYLNQDGTVSKKQPPPRFVREQVYRDEHDREAVRERVLQELREMRLVRAGKLAAYKNPGAMTCNGCGYRDICELHETGHDWQEMMNQTMEKWEPFAAHELAEGR